MLTTYIDDYENIICYYKRIILNNLNIACNHCEVITRCIT